MTIPLIVLLVALGLFVLLGFALVGLGVWLLDDNTPIAVFAGLIVAAIATGAIAGVAYHPSAPSCRLAPSSLVESPK